MLVELRILQSATLLPHQDQQRAVFIYFSGSMFYVLRLALSEAVAGQQLGLLTTEPKLFPSPCFDENHIKEKSPPPGSMFSSEAVRGSADIHSTSSGFLKFGAQQGYIQVKLRLWREIITFPVVMSRSIYFKMNI